MNWIVAGFAIVGVIGVAAVLWERRRRKRIGDGANVSHPESHHLLAERERAMNPPGAHGGWNAPHGGL